MIDYTKHKPSTPAISLEKVREDAPELVDLYKSAQISLEKQQIAGSRAAVYLVLDRSASMRKQYKNGAMQRLSERVLALSAHLDDDGIVPVVFFSTDTHIDEVSLQQYTGRVDAVHRSLGRMGGTDYATAMQAVTEHYQHSGSTDPALVIFQTDGSPNSRRAAEKTLCGASSLPLFWQFIGLGADHFNFLKKLDELPAKKRTVDNAGFFQVGDLEELTDQQLYDQLLAEYPQWLQAAAEAGVLR